MFSRNSSSSLIKSKEKQLLETANTFWLMFASTTLVFSIAHLRLSSLDLWEIVLDVDLLSTTWACSAIWSF